MHNDIRDKGGHRNDAGMVERECIFFEEIKVSNALVMALWSSNKVAFAKSDPKARRDFEIL